MDMRLSDLIEYMTKICQKRTIKQIDIYHTSERLEVEIFFHTTEDLKKSVAEKIMWARKLLGQDVEDFSTQDPSVDDENINRIPERS